MKFVARLALLLVIGTNLFPYIALAQTLGPTSAPCDTTACAGSTASPTQQPTRPSVPPPICNMSLKPTVISVGGSVTLTWTSQGATSASISSVGPVDLNGVINLLPSSAAQTTFVGTFTGPGGTTRCQAVVQVSTSGVGDSGTGVNGGGVQNATVPSPTQTYSQTPVSGAPPAVQSQNGGLVPCGVSVAGDYMNATACQACNLAQLVQNLINFLIGISIPLAAALFAYAGILYFTNAEDHGKIERAKEIFKSVFIGFLITISAYLVVNTIMHAILDQGEFAGGNWFSIQCSSGRQVQGTVNQLLNSVLPGINTQSLPPGQITFQSSSAVNCNAAGCFDNQGVVLSTDPTTGAFVNNSSAGLGGMCAPGYTYAQDGNDTATGSCFDQSGNVADPTTFGGISKYTEPASYGTCYSGDSLQNGQCTDTSGTTYSPFAQSNGSVGPEGACKGGYHYTEDSEYAWCQGPGGPNDILDFLSPGQGGGPILTCNTNNPNCGNITAAALAYKGADTSNGPAATEAGNKACAWAVNNVLEAAGIAPIDGLAVRSMEAELNAGRGTPVDQGGSQPGDIVIFGGLSHVGICMNVGCTQTLNNSSSGSFSGTYGATPGSRFYHVNQ